MTDITNPLKLQELVAKNKIHVDVRPLKKVIRRFASLSRVQDAAYCLCMSPLEHWNSLPCVELGSFETLMQKHQLFHDWASTQDAQYSLDILRREEEIELAKRDIEQLQTNLDAALKRKAEKIVYDVMANEIQKYPARDKSHQLVNKLNQDIRKLELQGEVNKRARLLRKESVRDMVQSLHLIHDAMLVEHARNQQALEDKLAESGGLDEEDENLPQISMEDEEEGALDEDRDAMVL